MTERQAIRFVAPIIILFMLFLMVVTIKILVVYKLTVFEMAANIVGLVLMLLVIVRCCWLLKRTKKQR